MRVKVGENWFIPMPGQPIMIEMTDADRSNIINMAPHHTKYAAFDDDLSNEERLAWMDQK